MSSNRNVLNIPWAWVALGSLMLVITAILAPNLMRSKIASNVATSIAPPRSMLAELRSVSFQNQDKAGADQSASVDDGRKLVRTSAIEMIVRLPDQTCNQIAQLARDAGGYVVTSQVNGNQNSPSASLTIRVPAAKFEEVRTQLRRLGLRVESERIEAQDVTKQYVDQEARLRNLRAEEQQYLGILRKASNVKDTLEVSDKLNVTRGAIEERQAEFEALSKQVETVAINVTLRAEADAQVFGLHWRPLYQLKIAARDGLDGLGDYAASMIAMVFYLPAILLWMFTIIAGAAIGWRILRWVGRVVFGFRASPVREQQV